MTVSVLIPAFRPTYLGQAIASVLSQGHEDYELLINDDSTGDEVAAVVKRFRDPRIRYSRTAGAQGGAENTRQLWSMAGRELVKFLFDDDVLLPNALGDLVDLVDAHPQASFTFGHRDVMNAEGRIQSEPRVIAPGKVAVLGPKEFSGLLIPTLHNRIGEFPNVLINRRAGVDLDDMFVYAGFALEMLVDVSFFLTAARKGPGVGTSRVVARYRKHGAQNSSIGYHPRFFKGFMEWELFIRAERGYGHLTVEQALQAIAKLETAYTNWGVRLPELLILREGLPGLRERVSAGETDLFDPEFHRRWDETVEAARQRNAAQPAVLEDRKADPR